MIDPFTLSLMAYIGRKRPEIGPGKKTLDFYWKRFYNTNPIYHKPPIGITGSRRRAAQRKQKQEYT